MHCPSATTDSKNPEEFDFLDILAVVSEHIKLLVIGPLLIGLTALLVGLWLPKSFESTSILDAGKSGLSITPSLIVSLAASADFLDNVALDQGIAKDKLKSARVNVISTLVSASISRQDKLVTLRTLGPTPEAAQKLNTAVWKHLLPLSMPRGGEMLRLQALLKSEQIRLAEGSELENTLAQNLKTGHGTADSARFYGELLAANSNRMRAITSLQVQLEGLTTDDIVQTPSLPEKALKPKPTLIATVATLASGMLLLLFIFARHALQAACRRPEQAAKIARMRHGI